MEAKAGLLFNHTCLVPLTVYVRTFYPTSESSPILPHCSADPCGNNCLFCLLNEAAQLDHGHYTHLQSTILFESLVGHFVTDQEII